jgi:hypothetical protein
VEEYQKMAGFVRATKNGQFNESTQRLVTEGINHYQSLRETLTRMAGRRGYHAYFESYTPVLNEESLEESNINELFVQEKLDPRIESALPILNRLSKNITEMSAVKELEEWAQSVTEVEDQTTKTLAEPADEMLDEAPGAETLKHNQDTEKSNLKAFDLAEKSARMGKNKTAKTAVPKTGASALDKAKQDAKDTEEKNPLFKKWNSDDIEQYGKIAKPIAGIAEGFSDSREVADQIIDSIGGEEGLSLDEVYRAIEEYQSMMDDPHKLDVDEVAQIVLDKLHGVGELEEELDANQKRAGQLGPTEPVGKNEKNLRGKLVGASESVELDTLKALSGIK